MNEALKQKLITKAVKVFAENKYPIPESTVRVKLDYIIEEMPEGTTEDHIWLFGLLLGVSLQSFRMEEWCRQQDKKLDSGDPSEAWKNG